jgi:DNA-binding CsgD family transcriptional regulator
MRAQGVSEVVGIRRATVYTHVRNAIHKLNVDSRTQAVAIAVRYRYLTNGRDGDKGG